MSKRKLNAKPDKQSLVTCAASDCDKKIHANSLDYILQTHSCHHCHLIYCSEHLRIDEPLCEHNSLTCYRCDGKDCRKCLRNDPKEYALMQLENVTKIKQLLCNVGSNDDPLKDTQDKKYWENIVEKQKARIKVLTDRFYELGIRESICSDCHKITLRYSCIECGGVCPECHGESKKCTLCGKQMCSMTLQMHVCKKK